MSTKKKVKPAVKVPRGYVKKPSTFREAKKIFVRFLNEGTSESKRFWDVISALRGPDYQDDSSKDKFSTTSVIREKFGIKHKASLGLVIHKDSPTYAAHRTLKIGFFVEDIRSRSSHFARHAKDAFIALGLKWEDAN